MARDWSRYTAERVRTGTDKNGRRLVLEFSAEFQKLFKRDLEIGCPKCFTNEYKTFLNKIDMAKDAPKCDYELIPKFNGLQLVAGSKVIISKHNITNELAERFAKEHPKGLALFSKYPEPGDADTAADPKKELLKLNRDALDERANALGLDGPGYANKGAVADAIIAAQADTKTDPLLG